YRWHLTPQRYCSTLLPILQLHSKHHCCHRQPPQKLAREYCNIVVVSGATDIVTDGQRAAYVENGHHMMGTITGTGCMLASVVACFAAVEAEYFKASLTALTTFGLAGELTITRPGVKGPGSFKVGFFDEIYNLTEEKIKNGARYRIETEQSSV
ncbi:MAG TPA: hypothetical protein GXX59_00950, partial [Syntrophomonadaceae bacterium]|nr:hypothetical protein [Syntrophomonadaceae bacterium]